MGGDWAITLSSRIARARVVPLRLLAEHDLTVREAFPDMQPLLDVQNLSGRYRPPGGGEVFALRGANRQMARGQIVGGLGESGSGKGRRAAGGWAVLSMSGGI